MTTLYLIRHSEPMKDLIGSNNSSESDQLKNEKNILTPHGEELAFALSKREELQSVDVLYTSNFARTMGTAKYIAFNNNIEMNIDERLGERKFGDMTNFSGDFFVHQWTDQDYKLPDGESINDTRKRITECITEIINNNKDKTICIVSHGTALSSYFLNFFEFAGADRGQLHFNYNGEEIFDGWWKAPHMFKFELDDNNNLTEFKNIG